MSKHPHYPLSVPNGQGTLLLTPCPGTVEAGVGPSLQQLKAAGATAVVTLLSQEELARSGAEQLPDYCKTQGLDWFHLPIEDERAPGETFARAWTQAGTRIHQHLDAGNAVAIHCKGGSGRTGLLAAQILVERGVPAADAIRAVQAIRPKAFQRPLQRAYVEQLG
jgi:protein-tyrosine phosphatase